MIYDFLMFMGIFMFLFGCSGDNNILNDKNPKESYNKLGWPYKALLWGSGLSIVLNTYSSSLIINTPTIYSIQIKGTIDNEMFLYVEERLRQIKNIGNASAIILDIDSGGGLVSPTIKIAKALEEFRNKRKKKTEDRFAIYSMVYSGLCASGAYWIASVSDLIFATEDSVLGSIGVRTQIFNFNRLLNKLGVKAETVSGGEKKVTWDIFGENPKEATEDLKKEIGKIHDLFIDTTYRNRKSNIDGIEKDKWEKICDGSTFLGNEIFGKGTIDNEINDNPEKRKTNRKETMKNFMLINKKKISKIKEEINILKEKGEYGKASEEEELKRLEKEKKYKFSVYLADYPFIYKDDVYEFVQNLYSIPNDVQILPEKPVTSAFKSIFKKKEKRETGIQKLLTYNPKKFVM
jgi:protease IV